MRLLHESILNLNVDLLRRGIHYWIEIRMRACASVCMRVCVSRSPSLRSLRFSFARRTCYYFVVVIIIGVAVVVVDGDGVTSVVAIRFDD